MPEVSPLAMPSPGLSIPSGSLVTPSGSAGPPGPGTPSANTGNLLTSGTDALLYLPGSAITPTIWSARLRSFNSIGNPTFEVDQRNVGTAVTIATGSAQPIIQDRWGITKGGTMTATGQQTAGLVAVPGTNFYITQNFLRITLTAQEASLAAGDYFSLTHSIEGPVLRELLGDVHSFQILVRSSVAGLVFGYSIRTAATPFYSLTNTLTIPSANTWTLLSTPNLPLWTPSGTFLTTPGNLGYILFICLAGGTSQLSPSNGSWLSGNYLGAAGQANFFASAVNSTFDIAYVGHEPGPVCTTLQDLDFPTNLDRCLRYYCKSYPYGSKAGAATGSGMPNIFVPGANSTYALTPIPFPKRMANTPTVIPYGNTSGASGVIRDASNNADRTASPNVVGDTSYSGCTVTSPAGTPTYINYQWQWVADTGW